MKQAFKWIAFVALLSRGVFGQEPARPTAFSAADVHVTNSRALAVGGPFVGGGLYRLTNATLVDLIALAYGVDGDKVAGGPAWLDTDRYDVTAKAPADLSIASTKTMLQMLLADRFKLVVHNGDSPLPAYALRATSKPLLKPSDGTGESGCKTQPVPGSFQLTNGGVSYACRNITSEAFADTIRGMVGPTSLNGYRVVDQTNLKGSWNFDLTFRRSMAAVPPGEEPLFFFDVLSKQLGLEISLTKVPMPALIVDSANQKPADNPLNLANSLPLLPTAFEVADIKSTPPDVRGSSTQVQPGGRVNVQGTSLTQLIVRAWELRSSEMVSGPKFLDTERFNIIAKIPDGLTVIRGPQDNDLIDPMLRTLLTERFKMVAHDEERPVTTYSLKAAKPKLQKADASNRTACLRGIGTGANAARANQVNLIELTCRNMTMAQFAKFLEGFPTTNLRGASIVDDTGLVGAFDFNLTFSPDVTGAAAGGDLSGVPAASTPSGRITLFEAIDGQLGLKLEATKRPGRVLVVDHIEQKPTEN